MYHRQKEEVADIRRSYWWLERAILKDITEALIMEAQDQGSITAERYSAGRTEIPLTQSETWQAVPGHSIHREAGIVYRNIDTEYGVDVSMSHWEAPQEVVENESQDPVGLLRSRLTSGGDSAKRSGG